MINWPADCYRGPRRDEYRTWRCRQITRVVEAVSREAKRVRPGIKISAAVFGAYPSCRQAVGQDWVAWVKAGYLDFLCPMDYSASDDAFADLVAGQVSLVGGRVPIYAGIGATAVNPPMTARQVLGQIEKARSLGASGFSIFNLDGKTIETLVPEVGKGRGWGMTGERCWKRYVKLIFSPCFSLICNRASALPRASSKGLCVCRVLRKYLNVANMSFTTPL